MARNALKEVLANPQGTTAPPVSEPSSAAPVNALVAALRKKPKKAQLQGPIAGLGQATNGASTSTTRVGY
ncbi:MAG TPA: hypothetical protein VGN13_05390 [Solirubrobacteraceae bacterium]|jgi:hypothetical protein